MGPRWALLSTAGLRSWLVHRARSLQSRCATVASACWVCGHGSSSRVVAGGPSALCGDADRAGHCTVIPAVQESSCSPYLRLLTHGSSLYASGEVLFDLEMRTAASALVTLILFPPLALASL